MGLRAWQGMLREARTALKKEAKGKREANEILEETKSELEEMLRESKQKEKELQEEVTREGTLKERLDANLAAERVQLEEAEATLKSQLSDSKIALREAEARATSFAKDYGKEFYLRKQIAEQLQV